MRGTRSSSNLASPLPFVITTNLKTGSLRVVRMARGSKFATRLPNDAKNFDVPLVRPPHIGVFSCRYYRPFQPGGKVGVRQHQFKACTSYSSSVVLNNTFTRRLPHFPAYPELSSRTNERYHE
jgi:hypothetical protein